MNLKGFIGPIGDDLPALIPIVTGLVIFLSIFVLTLNAYNSKNVFLNKQIDMIAVARDIKGDSLILGWDQFNDRCEGMKLKNYPYSFMVALYNTNVDVESILNDFISVSGSDLGYSFSSNEYDFLYDEVDGVNKNFLCEFVRVGGNNFSGSKRGYSIRFYPIAVQQKIQLSSLNTNAYSYVIVPALMVMVVWE